MRPKLSAEATFGLCMGIGIGLYTHNIAIGAVMAALWTILLRNAKRK